MGFVANVVRWMWYTLWLAAVILIVLPAALMAIVMCGSKE